MFGLFRSLFAPPVKPVTAKRGSWRNQHPAGTKLMRRFARNGSGSYALDLKRMGIECKETAAIAD